MCDPALPCSAGQNPQITFLMLTPCFILLCWEASEGPMESSFLVYQGGTLLMFVN